MLSSGSGVKPDAAIKRPLSSVSRHRRLLAGGLVTGDKGMELSSLAVLSTVATPGTQRDRQLEPGGHAIDGSAHE